MPKYTVFILGEVTITANNRAALRKQIEKLELHLEEKTQLCEVQTREVQNARGEEIMGPNVGW